MTPVAFIGRRIAPVAGIMNDPLGRGRPYSHACSLRVERLSCMTQRPYLRIQHRLGVEPGLAAQPGRQARKLAPWPGSNAGLAPTLQRWSKGGRSSVACVRSCSAAEDANPRWCTGRIRAGLRGLRHAAGGAQNGPDRARRASAPPRGSSALSATVSACAHRPPCAPAAAGAGRPSRRRRGAG
jgi:hypothetical protein